MAKGFKHGAGGSNPLNFKIVSYATEEELLAASPKENTIGIVTSDTITSWIFSDTEPTETIEGMVWISTGTSSPTTFNALKKNTLQVYPLSAKQYIGGAWVDKTAKSYQGGAWVDWILDINILEKGVNTASNWSGGSYQSDGTMKFTRPTNSNPYTQYTKTTYDLTHYNVLEVVITAVGNGYTAVGVMNAQTDSSSEVATIVNPKVGAHQVDISSITGAYPIGVWLAVGGSVTVSDITLKV